jgi:glutathione synthase/RimK-type ligase-like ATP-grasp enzyme
MKKVLILFGKNNWTQSRPFDNPDYMYSYEYFYDLCQKNGVQMYRASYQWYDYKEHIFKYAWIFESKGANWKRVYNIKPDLIYDKTKARLEVYHRKELIAKNYDFINDLNFTRIIDDKFITSVVFNKWSKKSWFIKNSSELKKVLPFLKSTKIVIKPNSESGGSGIQIFNKSEALKKATLEKEFLVQEFIDSSRGVPGVSNSLHDLRLVCINEKIIYSYIREPKKGSYLANLAQGGSLTIVPNSKLPSSLKPILKHATDTFKTFNPRIYSIDFMFDEKSKPWVVELNSMPGLYFTQAEKPYMLKMYRKLLETFKKKLEIKK